MIVDIASYDAFCRDIIDNMDSVKEFKKNYNEKYEEIYRFKASNSNLKKLLHPIKLIKTHFDSKRLITIYDGFYEIYNRSVMEYINEETGKLDDDLIIPTFESKPNHIDSYVKSIKLKKVRKKCT